ncbi:MAG: hypothetical protein JWQ36_1446 [Enterovirga sp.]|jgi:hypothetical protein|nr:hypothetical protein [Enterovirga sp.]
MRNLKSLLIAGGALASLASPAAAQWYGRSYNAPPPPYGYGEREYARPLARDEIVDRLEDRGFEDVARPRFDGSVYVVEATSRRGGAVRLVIDAYDGRILRQTPLSMARLAPFDDGIEVESYPSPSRRGAYLPPEMPNAPRYRPDEPDAPVGREAARPADPEVIIPSPGPRTRPADARLSPDSPGASAEPPEPAPRREARRPASPDAGVPSGEVNGLNPDRGRAGSPAQKPNTASRPEKPDEAGGSKAAATDKPAVPPKPAARTSPAAPVPSTASRPAEKVPAAPGPETAEAGERKVRVIEGVTPMNTGQQASPAPQNNVERKPDQAGKN